MAGRNGAHDIARLKTLCPGRRVRGRHETIVAVFGVDGSTDFLSQASASVEPPSKSSGLFDLKPRGK